MPQLAPLNWFLLVFLFWFFVFFVTVFIWWLGDSSYSVNHELSNEGKSLLCRWMW
uniref:ATP synthase F0 subunit 8 n=1 Tax=Nuttallochiton mirandus TaxID=256062 RepID=A0A6H1PFZ0_NULMI|nr:ATP synthase F0 subunit 8 [Nuttallochiton mirandus]